MGSWGPKLYQDDVAKDVKSEFTDLLKRGKTSSEATEHLIATYTHLMEDQDDAPVFWFALADTQWDLGILLPDVKEQAFRWLAAGTDLRTWQEENPKGAQVREKVLQSLANKLNSPMPPEKRISPYRLYSCEWELGDTFAYRLEGELAKEKGLCGEYLIIHKVDEYIWHPGHVIPIVWVKITKGGAVPHGIEELNSLEFVQTGVTRYENRFLPYDVREPKEETLKKRSEINYFPDSFGFLRHYRTKLISTSKRVIPKRLEYLGKLGNMTPPRGEFIPHDKLAISACSWKDLEKTLITKYCYYSRL